MWQESNNDIDATYLYTTLHTYFNGKCTSTVWNVYSPLPDTHTQTNVSANKYISVKFLSNVYLLSP